MRTSCSVTQVGYRYYSLDKCNYHNCMHPQFLRGRKCGRAVKKVETSEDGTNENWNREYFRVPGDNYV